MSSKRNANPTKGRGNTVGFIGATSSKGHDEESGALARAKSHRHGTPPLAVAVNRAEDPRGSVYTRILLPRLDPSLHLLSLAISITSERVFGRKEPCARGTSMRDSPNGRPACACAGPIP